MYKSSVLATAISVLLATNAEAQNNGGNSGPVALTDRRYPYNQIPYLVDTFDGKRGRQIGFNQCNATTQNQQSMCQTMVINSYDDFCLWAPPFLTTVAELEAGMVAWCTKPTHGARVIPNGALQGVQFMRTPHYIQVTGFINQPLLDLYANDTGGELDPRGDDERGNPLGGLAYSTAFGDQSTSVSVNGSQWTQVINWNQFIGGGIFCLKACDPSYPEAYRMCDNVYDRVGCNYNMPAAYVNGTFESCQGDDQLPVGIYVGNDSVTSTWSQPPESLGPITSIPYTPQIPKSSSCTPFASESVYSFMPGGVNGTDTTSSVMPSSTSSDASSTDASGSSSGAAGGATSGGSSSSSSSSSSSKAKTAAGSTGSSSNSNGNNSGSSSGASSSITGSGSSYLGAVVAGGALLLGLVTLL